MTAFDTTVAIVGMGFIGPVHLEALRRLGIQVKGILCKDLDETQSVQQQFGLPHSYPSYQDILNDSEIDSIHLAVPNVMHYEMAKEALNAGKHVLCEKPLAMNTRETGELVQLAGSKQVAAGVCYNVRFYPINLEAMQWVKQGDVGEIHFVQGSYVQDWMLYATDYNWRVLADQGGPLRAVADIGTHWMDLLQTISGLKIVEVLADLHTVHKQRQRPKDEVQTFTGKLETVADTETIDINTEDAGSILLRFDNGARGSLHVSQVTAGRKNCIRYELSGSKCALAWNSESPNELWIGRREQPNQTLLRDPSLVSDVTRPYINYPGGHNEGFPDTFKQCFRTFYDYIAKGDFNAAPKFPTFNDGHKEVKLCEAILKSHQHQSWVPIQEKTS